MCSCPNNDAYVEILFCPFLYSILLILCSESVAAEKKRNILLRIRVYFVSFFVFFVLEFRF